MDFARGKRNCVPSMIFKNGRFIFPNGVRDGLDLVAENGMITAIRGPSPAMGETIIDLENNYLSPGFIDLHVHGAVGRDTMQASAHAFRAICDYHASGGTTSLLLTTATAPIKAIVKVLNEVRAAKSSIKQIAGVHVEGPFISKAKPGAQRSSLMRKPTRGIYRPLLEHNDVIKRMTLAPELPGAIALIDELRKHGISMLYRAKNFSGICLATDATAGAGLPDGSKFSLYGTKCITEAGVCLLADRSALAGSASRMIDLVRTMVTKVGVPLHEAIVMATDTPAFVIGLTGKGQFKIGDAADLVVISPELEVLRTFIAGEEVFRR